MYIPKHFSENDHEALNEVIRAYPLATLVTNASGNLDANHLPLHFTQRENSLGTLSGHVARANPLGKQIVAGQKVLAIFHGPQAYITPSWYPSKLHTSMVVPTWNYVVVHAHGQLTLRDDAEWLRKHLETLTAKHETGFEKPWQVEDAPLAFIETLIRAVVGIEIEITRLAGKCKVSQNQPVENQIGVMQGLRESEHEKDHEMASIIQRINHL
ncbi:MAG TPA: FMN-binding negative transcriptional regulator [Methylophilus sp.]|nr:FMN-binding negative transcriptional regulator [Methylophilus sp.]